MFQLSWICSRIFFCSLLIHADCRFAFSRVVWTSNRLAWFRFRVAASNPQNLDPSFTQKPCTKSRTWLHSMVNLGCIDPVTFSIISPEASKRTLYKDFFSATLASGLLLKYSHKLLVGVWVCACNCSPWAWRRWLLRSAQLSTKLSSNARIWSRWY